MFVCSIQGIGGCVQMSMCVAHHNLTEQESSWLWNTYA